jgi:hypothetical protein
MVAEGRGRLSRHERFSDGMRSGCFTDVSGGTNFPAVRVLLLEHIACRYLLRENWIVQNCLAPAASSFRSRPLKKLANRPSGLAECDRRLWAESKPEAMSVGKGSQTLIWLQLAASKHSLGSGASCFAVDVPIAAALLASDSGAAWAIVTRFMQRKSRRPVVHSTVTLFARLRGLSTSVPRASAA